MFTTVFVDIDSIVDFKNNIVPKFISIVIDIKEGWMDYEKEIEERFISMAEDDFSRNILIYLFKKMFPGVRVEFVGGVAEKGRDILIYKTDEFGCLDIIGVQVKKIKPSVNAKADSFQQLITQIDQMRSEGVVNRDTGEKIKISSLVFVTPYIIGERVLDSHNGAFRSILEKNVKIIDGFKLVELFDKYCPGFLGNVMGVKYIAKKEISPKLSNERLMAALQFKKTKHLCDIYCDIGFNIVGRKYSRYILNQVEIGGGSSNISVNISDIDMVAADNVFFKERFGFELYGKNLSHVIARVQKEHSRVESDISKLYLKINSSENFLSTLVMNSFISIGFEVSSRFEGYLNNVDKLDELTKDEVDELNVVRSKYSNHKALLDRYNLLRKKQSCIEVEVPYNSAALSNRIKEVKCNLLDEINKDVMCVQGFMKCVHDLLVLLNTVCKNEKMFELKPANDLYDKIFDSVDVPIFEIFDSGYDIVVLGEAGSGKTTNLQHYAATLYNKKDGFVIYSTLTNLAGYSDGECLVSGLCNYIGSLAHDVDYNDVRNAVFNEKAVLLLDSVDEAIKSYPWIITALSKLKVTLHKCQVITSSRYSIDGIYELGFINVALLPFNEYQKKDFFFKWFCNDRSKAENIIEHLASFSELNKVVNNPLSSTILAVLCENNIPLPSSEASLYEKRFELLSGRFDQFKGVDRMESSPDALIKAAKHIAFENHLSGSRSLDKKTAVDYLDTPYFSSMYSPELIVEELVVPSEILVGTFDDKYDFGHLRFQEYLASEEINYRRNVNYIKLLQDDWWHDVFVLYAQHAKDIFWIIDIVIANELTYKVKSLLREMISHLPEVVREEATKRMNSALVSEVDEVDSDSDDEFFGEDLYSNW